MRCRGLPVTPSNSIKTAVAISTALPIHRLDAEQYGQVVASGALDDQRVELIDGVLVDMSPHSPQHSGIIQRMTEHLSGAAAGLRVQLPLQVAADSIPEPDRSASCSIGSWPASLAAA